MILNQYRPTLIASIAYVLVAIAFSLFYLNDTRHFLQRIDAGKTEAQAQLTAQGIGYYYQGLERQLDLFVQGHIKQSNQLYENPDNEALYRQILSELRVYFPSIRSFTLATPQGEPVLADFDGFISNICRTDIKTKAKHPHADILRLHPNPGFEHIDVMSEWAGPDGEERIFFINYAAESVTERLAALAIPTVKQMLVQRAHPDVIEFTEQGARNSYVRDWTLDSLALDRLPYRQLSPVPGTRWDVLTYLDPAAEEATNRFFRDKIWLLISVEVLFGLMFIPLVWYLNDRLLRQVRQMQALAQHDELTGLINHAWFISRLEQSLLEAERSKTTVAVMFIDLDRFKPINDQYGHLVGNQVLQEIGRRLQALFRKSDIVARYGGDEFVVALTELKNVDHLGLIVEKTLAAIREPIVIQDVVHQLSASIGMATQDEDHRTVQDLIRLADTRMYQQKQAAREAQHELLDLA